MPRYQLSTSSSWQKYFIMHNNILAYNGQQISQRADGYVNATQMAKANNVNHNDFTSNSETIAYIDTLSLVTGIPAVSLIVRLSEGFPAQKNTWMHPLLALNFGRWISPDFAIWCDQHIKTLIETGKAEISKDPVLPQTYLEALEALVEKEKESLTLKSQIAENAPKVALAEDILECEGIPIGDFAKELNLTRNKTFQELRDLGFIQKVPSVLPYQSQINNGNFTVTAVVKQDSYGKLRNFPVALITGKGIQAFHKKRSQAIAKDRAIIKVESAIDCQLTLISDWQIR